LTIEQIEEALRRLQTFATFLGQLEPLTPNLDAAIDDLCVAASRIAQRLEEMRNAPYDSDDEA
jgi:hypothetical protein